MVSILPPSGQTPTPAPAAKSITGVVRKREVTDSDEAEPHASSKRQRVVFDPEVNVCIMEEWEKSPDIIREEVRRGLERHTSAVDSGYDQIQEIFSMDPRDDGAPSSSTIKNYILALISNVSLLGKKCAGLVQSVLDSNWLGRDDAFVALYVRFLGNLASAQPGYTGAVLKMLVTNLSNTQGATGRLPNLPIVRRPQYFSRTHMALRFLLQLIPSASGALSPILAATFPHPSDTKKTHVDYVKNLIRILEYAPELRANVLSLITERLVKIDVQIQIELEDLEEEAGENVIHGASLHVDDSKGDIVSDTDESEVGSVSSEEDMDEEAQRIQEVRSNIAKMDAILDMLFTFYEPCFSKTRTNDSNKVFDLLLAHLTTIILPTYRSRHTQFLLFHFAQTSSQLVERFTGLCMTTARDDKRPTIVRQTSTAYLASFIARGAHVESHVVRDVFAHIGVLLERIRFEQESACRGPDLRRHGLYYSLSQALLYIFCFRWRDLLASPEDYVEEDDPATFDGEELTWSTGVKEILIRSIYSKFNPLKVCSPSIANEFARVANHLRFIYVYPLLETNKRLRLSQFLGYGHSASAYNQPSRETALSARKDEGQYQLDTYFPFDPYSLPISKRWIESDYLEWKGVPGLRDPEADVDSEMEADEQHGDLVGDGGTETDGSD
ncbi:MAG: hypothetical protein M1835_000124 [Candelina submexicana]|nr:MAG: hypothetical protein M1835_000124 [Candelina submexicana]